jgi:FkbM family methyltransferase
MHFALLAGPTGKVLAVEPDPTSVDRLRGVAARHGVTQLTVDEHAAWSEQATLVLHINDKHPATNFTQGCADYTDEQLAGFRRVELSARPLDEILKEHGIDHVDLVSITTNGAEQEILAGLSDTIARGVAYICLARTSELDRFTSMLKSVGYDFVSHDDRGYTFTKADR